MPLWKPFCQWFDSLFHSLPTSVTSVFLRFCEKHSQLSFCPAISCNLFHMLPLFLAQFPSLILPLSVSIRHLRLIIYWESAWRNVKAETRQTEGPWSSACSATNILRSLPLSQLLQQFEVTDGWEEDKVLWNYSVLSN